MTNEQKALLLSIAHNFPGSDGIHEWAEHLEKHPGLARFELTEQNAPIVAWLIVELWKATGGGVPRVEPAWVAAMHRGGK